MAKRKNKRWGKKERKRQTGRKKWKRRKIRIKEISFSGEVREGIITDEEGSGTEGGAKA